ncbi:MAG: aryl-sulfate sulfotransferase [Chitinophagales bacterium]|nr:aryl-sulfate sulfotransferase [Chitinophagales bacterium]
MKFFFTLITCAYVWLTAFTAQAQFVYVFPKPGTTYHLPDETIILRNGSLLDAASIRNPSLVQIHGSLSGLHTWTPILSEYKTLIIKSDNPYAWGETVNVVINDGLKKKDGSKIKGIAFSFQIRNQPTPEEEERIRLSDLNALKEDHNLYTSPRGNNPILGDLDSMPTFKITTNNNPAKGQFFYCSQSEDLADSSYYPSIINNDGSVVWAEDAGLRGHDFKIDYNGDLSYYDYINNYFAIVDSNFNQVDSFECIGFVTNAHDMVRYSDKHTFLIGTDDRIMDLSQIVPGGQPNALLKGAVIQELDSAKNVIFQWNGFDYFKVTDADSNTSLTNGIVDYEHANAIERDYDGNILLSSRNFSEITKINTSTGNIIWRLGGENNQFDFKIDNIKQHFSYQHDIRRIANGNITLYNNGDYLPKQRSSAKEYSLDEKNKIATLVWFYEHPDVIRPDSIKGFDTSKVYGRASGSVQRLPNGNTFICWGDVYSKKDIPDMTEVDMDGNITWEMSFDDTSQKSYRAHKYVWDPCSRVTGYTLQSFPDSLQTFLSWGAASGAISYQVQYRPKGSAEWQSVPADSFSVLLSGLVPATTYEWRVVTICSDSASASSPYSVTDTFTTPVALYIDQIGKSLISVYPVPASTQLNIEIKNTDANLITISNTIGMIVYSKKIYSGTSHSIVQVDIHHWPQGIYQVEIDNGKSRDLRKFIKQ